MTDADESLLAAANLRETVRESPDGFLKRHAGVVDDNNQQAAYNFLDDIFRADTSSSAFTETHLGSVLLSKAETAAATQAIHDGNSSLASYLVGLTESNLNADPLRLPMSINEALDNNAAPAFVVGKGNPNTGKTNTMCLLAELRSITQPELMVLSNVATWDQTDDLVTSAHDLAVSLLDNRDRPKFVFIDEASTHFDARTFRREVANQWTPLAKRFAKIGVDVCGLVCHTGKDLHPEAKRLATLPYIKLSKTEAEFYHRWPSDSEDPEEKRFGGSLEGLQAAASEPNPDDAAPWSWNLRPELFANDYGWPGLLDALRQAGPAD